MAFDTVAKENAGFNTFGWDTGDTNQNGKRDSYDEGDNGAGGGIAKNGIQDGDEVFTGHKVYDETFTKVFSLKKNGTGSYDRDALNRLETAINANLDPKLHITIKDDGEIIMANGAQDPWNKEYHGWYITNAEVDGQDRGAIVMYSDGANNEFGSEHTIANGVVSISIPGSNKYGKDDYAVVSCYTYLNGYGEVKNMTSGFSNNQNFVTNGTNNNTNIGNGDNLGNDEPSIPDPIELEAGLYDTEGQLIASWDELVNTYGMDASVDYTSGSYRKTATSPYCVLTNNTDLASGVNLVIGDATKIGNYAFTECKSLTSINIPDSITTIGSSAFYYCTSLTSVTIGNGVTTIGEGAFERCTSLTSVTIPDSVTSIGDEAFYGCSKLTSVTLGNGVTRISQSMFNRCTSLVSVTMGNNVTSIGSYAFYICENLTSITISDSVKTIGDEAFVYCDKLESVVIGSNVVNIKYQSFSGCTKLTNITFNGTMSQWNNITKGSNWNKNVSATYVQCLDGQTTLN